MPHVTVKLIYTPKPERDRVTVNEGIDVWMGADTTICTDGDAFADPPEAVAVALPARWLSSPGALTSVGGVGTGKRGKPTATCWRRRRSVSGTPTKRDAVQAIRTLFGYGVHVTLDYGSGSGLPRLRFADDIHALAETIPVPNDNIGANYCPDSSLLNYAAAHLAADDTPEAEQ